MVDFNIGVLTSEKMIQQIIYLQVKVIGVLTICTLLLLIWRKQRAKRMASLSRHYGMLLINQTLSESLGEESERLIKRPSAWHPFKNEILKQTLLEHMHLMSGREREHIVQFYIDLGFASEDVGNTVSLAWGTRLEAISNLRLLERKQLAPVMLKMTWDSNRFIAACAYIGLSAIAHDLNTPAILANIPDELLERSNVVIEIATNICRMHGARSLVEFATGQYPEALQRACISAITNSRTEECQLILLELIDPALKSNLPMLPALIGALRHFGDPAHAEIILKFVVHENPRVRAEAANWFISIETNETGAVMDRLVDDPNPEVRRIVKGYFYKKMHEESNLGETDHKSNPSSAREAA